MMIQQGKICKSCKREIPRSILDSNLSVCHIVDIICGCMQKARILSLVDENHLESGMVKLNGLIH